LIGTLFVAAWSGTVFGVAEAPLFHKFASEFSSDSSDGPSLMFLDRYTIRTERPYFAGYDFLEKEGAQLIAAQQATTVKALGFGDGDILHWTVTYSNGTTAEYTHKSSESLSIKFSEAGTGSVSVTSSDGATTVSFSVRTSFLTCCYPEFLACLTLFSSMCSMETRCRKLSCLVT
jgi:hypothetical protein